MNISDKKNSLRLILLLAAVLYSPAPVFAETIVLKSGQKIEGRILEKTDKYIKIDFQGMPLTYYVDDIARIESTHNEMAKIADEESGEFLRANPNSAKAYNDRGVAYRMNGKQKEAIACFTKAIEIDPAYAQAYNNRGISYGSSEIKNYTLALYDFDKAIEIEPQNGEYYFDRAILYFDKKDYDKSWEDLHKAEALGFKNDFYISVLNEVKKVLPQYYNDLGFNYYKDGQLDRAISYYNKALEVEPRVALVYANRANAYSDKGELDRAIGDFSKAIEINPKDAALYHDRGSTYFKKGDLDRAIVDYSKAIEINANLYNGQFYNDRAVAYFFKGEYPKSWEDVRKALALGYNVDPGFLDQLKKASGKKRIK
jgi:tetratricopeptide (TPR) repeat protein